MRLVAIWDAALRPLSAGLRRVATQKTVETQPFRRQTLDALLDVRIDEDITGLSLMDAAANAADARRLLFRRRRHESLSVGRHRKLRPGSHRRGGNLRCRRRFRRNSATGQDRHPTRQLGD